MKKSFLKRVMAAAIAVPVALTQTVMFASFAEEETTTAGVNVLDKDAFVKISNTAEFLTPDGSYRAPEAGNEYALIQESDWNLKLYNAINVLSTSANPVLTLDKAQLADSINSNAWYADIARDVLADENTSATVKFESSNVIITFNVDYQFGASVADILRGQVPAEYEEDIKDLTSDAVLVGEVQIKASTTDLYPGKSTDVTVSFKIDDSKDGDKTFNTKMEKHDAILDYMEQLLNEVRADIEGELEKKVADYDAQKDAAEEKYAVAKDTAEERQAELDDLKAQGASADEIASAQAKLDAAVAEMNEKKEFFDEKLAQYNRGKELAEEKIEGIFSDYQSKLDKAQAKVAGLEQHREATLTGATFDEVLKQAQDNAANRIGMLERVPESLAAIRSDVQYPKAEKLFAEVLKQVNDLAANNGYQLDLALGDVLDVAETLTDVTVSDVTESFITDGYAWGYLQAEETVDPDSAVYSIYEAELEKLIPEDYVITNIYTVEVVEVESKADAKKMSGNGSLNIYRVVWCDVKEEEEETTTSTDETTTTEETTTSTDETTTTEETTTSTDETTTTEETTTSTDETTTTEETTTSTDETTTTEETTTSTDETTTTEETTTSTDETTTSTEETTTATDDTTTSSTETSDSTETTARTDVKVTAVREGITFYFSHDERTFDYEALIENATVEEDGEVVAADPAKFSFGLDKDGAVEGLSPADVYADRAEDSAYAAVTLYVYYEDILVDMDNKYPQVYIGVKGDANLDGVVNSDDAANVLIYAAEFGAGDDAYIFSSTNETLEKFAYFLADVTGESADKGETTAAGDEVSLLNSDDAAYILIYAAYAGAGEDIDWIDDVLDAPYPAISVAIKAAKA